MRRIDSRTFGVFVLMTQLLYSTGVHSAPSTGNTHLARNCAMFSPPPILPSSAVVKAGQHYTGEFAYLIRATMDFLRTWPAYEQCMHAATDGSEALSANLPLYGQTKKSYARFLADLRATCVRNATNNADYCALPALQVPSH